MIFKYECCNSLLDDDIDNSIPVIEQIPVNSDLQSVGSFVTVIGHRPNNN
jgi:hypothetical protein